MLPTRHISELQNDRVHHSYHSVYQKWTSVQIILAYGRVECFHLITTMYFHGVWLMASIFHTRKIDCPTGLISITEYTCITGVSNAPQKKWMRSFHMCNQFVLVSFWGDLSTRLVCSMALRAAIIFALIFNFFLILPWYPLTQT